MKKLLTIVLALTMILGCVATFASCSKKNEDLKFGKELLTVTSQLDALNGLLKGDADIAVIDSVMAGYYMNTGSTFKDYQILEGVVLAEEQYGIGAKKGNNALIGKVNEGLIALAANGGLATIANTYGLASELLVNATTANPNANATDNSWNEIVAAKKVIIGYTEFAPIAYKNDAGALIGFDIDLAKAVFAYLDPNVEVEFVVIEWNQKETLLENGTIDLVWNGMTITDERVANMAMSVPYLANKQVAVVAKKDASKYGSNMEEFLKKTNKCIVIVEAGSAGEEIVRPTEE